MKQTSYTKALVEYNQLYLEAIPKDYAMGYLHGMCEIGAKFFSKTKKLPRRKIKATKAKSKKLLEKLKAYPGIPVWDNKKRIIRFYEITDDRDIPVPEYLAGAYVGEDRGEYVLFVQDGKGGECFFFNDGCNFYWGLGDF